MSFNNKGYNQIMAQKNLLTTARSRLNVISETRRPSQYISFGLIGAMILLGLCVIIRPDSLSVNYGLSYFGIFTSTIIPYAAAFLLYAFSLWKASDLTLGSPIITKTLNWAMRIMSIQVIGLILTPYNRLYGIHVFFGAGLFSLQLLLSFMLLKWLISNWINIGLVVMEFLSGLASLYYLPQTHGLLLQTQVIFQLAFGVLLIRALGNLETSSISRSLQQVHHT